MALKRHYDGAHLRKREVTCPTCDKTISEKGSLKRHIRQVHEGEKEIKKGKCHICNKKFSKLKTMKEHVTMVHEG